MEDEDFMVWMQIELFPNFKKLYGKLNGTIEKGQEYTLQINFNEEYTETDGERYFVLSTTHALGEDKSLGWIFFIASIVMLSLSAAMVFLEYLKAIHKLPYQRKQRKNSYNIRTNISANQV